MNVRMLALRFGLLTSALYGAFAMWFGAGTAAAVTGSQIKVECHGWPSQTTVHWDAKYWLGQGKGEVTSIQMQWETWVYPWEAYAKREGETAHATTPLFSSSVDITMFFSDGRNTWSTSRDLTPCPGEKTFGFPSY